MGRPEHHARTAILVLGMHRSGTSALARLIGHLGAALPADAIEAHSDNAKGYWESAAIVRADDQLLRAARSSWFDPRALDLSRLEESALRSRKDRIWEAVTAAFGDASLFVMKDPRQCRFVPTVVETLAEHGVASRAALMLRNPAAIARSLASRDGTTSALAHLLWLRHMIDAERGSRHLIRAIIDFDAMLADWRGAAERLLPMTGGAMPEGERATAIAAFLDPGLRHHHDEEMLLEEPLAGLIAELKTGLDHLLAADDARARAALDAIYARYEAMQWLEGDIVHDELRHRRADGNVEPPIAVGAPLVAAVRPPSLPAATPPNAEAVAMIRASGLFDEGWYLATYPETRAAGIDAIEHYLTIGAARGYNPHPLFDTGFYARQMARRLAAGGEA